MANAATMESGSAVKGAAETRPASAVLSIGGTPLDLDIKHGTLGPDVIDITHLYRDTGMFTYDPGSASTASC